jgi:hypothetical protein
MHYISDSMNNRSKKYLEKGENDHPAIGNFVHWFIKNGHHKKKDVAQHLQIIPTTLNQYFKQQSLQFGILWRLSQAINYNMIMDLGQRLNIPFETDVEKELKAQLEGKEKEIESLKTQLGVYKQIHKVE